MSFLRFLCRIRTRGGHSQRHVPSCLHSSSTTCHPTQIGRWCSTTRQDVDRAGGQGRVVACRYGLPGGGLVLIRPDGYVGLLSELITTEPIRDYLNELGSPRPEQ